jgi:hypothetical protein
MKKLITTIAVGFIAVATLVAIATVTVSAAASSGHAATTTTTTLAPNHEVGQNHVFFYVDTVTGGGTPTPPAGCAMTNLFEQGQVVVFRMFGIHVTTGGTTLTQPAVLAAWLTIPGVKRIYLTWGSHETSAYWTAPWSTKGYTLGVVNFTVTVVTKAIPATKTSPAIPQQIGVFSQKGFPPPSVLTVVKA